MWGLRSTEGKRRLGGVIALGQSLLPSQMASSIRNERYLILDADIVKTSVILLAKKLLPPGGIPSPGGKIEPAEVVHLGYVLNVIEEPSERSDTQRRAFDLCTEVLIVAVRIDQMAGDLTEFNDGVLTTKGTFQKIFSQLELREYIETTLGKRPYMAGLGIAYVFQSSESEAR